eukprot:gene4619-6498_t
MSFNNILAAIKNGNYSKSIQEFDPIRIGISLFMVVLGLALFARSFSTPSSGKSRVNNQIKLNEPKVVDTVDCVEIENLAQFKDGKLVMCRCWKSDKFPYCDGSHVKHNKETGDNVGPLLIKK